MVRKKYNKKGFTLIEAIVVAVIILVLAAVAIPIYNGFVRDARQDTVDNLAETAAAAANTYTRKHGNDDALIDVGPLNIYYDDTKYEINIDNGANTITVTDKKDASITKQVNY